MPGGAAERSATRLEQPPGNTVVSGDGSQAVSTHTCPQMEPRKLTLVRIVAPHFVAGIETDGTVRRAAPIIGYMLGWTDAEVREHVWAQN